MSWTYEEIERDWLGGSPIAVGPTEAVAAFDRCEGVMGRDWIDRARAGAPGYAPTLNIVALGQQLASLQDIVDSQQLIDKLRAGQDSAFAELRAIHLLRWHGTPLVELEPTIATPDGYRKCDFRIQQPDQPWVYVEVTRPDTSDAQARLDAVLSSVRDKIISVRRSFTLEVFFRREPTDDEIDGVLAHVLAFCSTEHAAGTVEREEMPNGMGLLILNEQPAGQVVLNDHGEDVVPRLGGARAIIGPGEPNRHVVVRMPYADQRAEEFLRSEARQLPIDAHGLVMVEMARAPGGFSSWEPIIQRRFQPTLHTRVGGVCLFSTGLVPSDHGAANLFQTKLITNQHARVPLPAWIKTTIDAAGEEFKASAHPRG